MQPTSIKKTSDIITIAWDDGITTSHTVQQLRDECPCAGCKGETVLMHTILPIIQPKLPGHYEIKSITPVGSYAIQIVWGDGHDTGLYAWEYLRKLNSKS